jgi:serine/threonine protein kinase
MERCEGTLAEYLAHMREQGKEIEGPELVEIMIQILSGLSHCHDRGVCHRDLKLSNSTHSVIHS